MMLLVFSCFETTEIPEMERQYSIQFFFGHPEQQINRIYHAYYAHLPSTVQSDVRKVLAFRNSRMKWLKILLHKIKELVLS